MTIRTPIALVLTTMLLSGLSAAAPPAPGALTATPGDGQVVLSWDASPGAVSYTLYRSETVHSGFTDYTAIAAGLAGTTHTDTGLTNGNPYYYLVKAVDGAAEESERSNGVAAIAAPAPPSPVMGSLSYLIPKPVSVVATGAVFALTEATDIYVSDEAGVSAVGDYLESKLETSTGFAIEVITTTSAPGSGHIYLEVDASYEPAKPEAYRLEITPALVTLTANGPEGLFRGIQTIRQALPYQIDFQSAAFPGASWLIPTGVIEDYPRFAHRGIMLDTNGFPPLEDFKKQFDTLALYKLNVVHLKLNPSKGYRVEIVGHPGVVAEKHWTQAEFAELVAYADSLHMTLIPQFNEDQMGSQTADTITQIAALTTGPYYHIGANPDDGKEPTQAFLDYIAEIQALVEAAGKSTIGWEIGNGELLPDTVQQHWRTDWPGTELALAQGNKIIVSESSKIFFDGKYNDSIPFGGDWMGRNPTIDSYNWDPMDYAYGYPEEMVLGVQAVLWTGVAGAGDHDSGAVDRWHFEFLTYPRMQGVAELGWSPRVGRDWDEYKIRLGQHGSRMTAMDVTFFDTAGADEPVPFDLWYDPQPEPAGLVAVSTVGQVALDWNDLSTGDLDSYNVYRGTNAGGPYASVATGLTSSDYTDTTTTDGTTYHYVVTALDGSLVESGYSNEVAARPPVAPLVSNSAATLVGSATATLRGNVDDSGGDYPEVTIHWGDEDGGTGTWDHTIPLGRLENGAFSTDVAGLASETTYYYRIHAENSAGSNWAAGTQTFTTLPAIPTAPSGLAALAGIGQVALDWDDSTLPDFASFSIYRSNTPGSGFTLLASGLTGSAYADTAVASGETWHYRVTVENTLGNESLQSGEVSATVGSGGASVLVNLDSAGRTNGGGYTNGGIFSAWTLDSGSVTGGATTTQTGAWGYDDAIDTGTMTLLVDDRGWGGSGAVFQFDLEVHLFNDAPGGAGDVKQRTAGFNLSADTFNSADDRNATEALTAGGRREFNTVRITNLTSISGPVVSSGGLSGLNIKDLTDAADAGIIYLEGDLTKTPIATWDNSSNVQTMPFSGETAVTLEPTGDGFKLQGFTASFEVSSGAGVAPYDDWAAGPWTNGALTDSSPALDFDHGGLPTGIEWVTGGDPTDPGDDAGKAPTIDNSDPDDFLFIFRRSDAAHADANTTIVVDYGSDLTSWRNTTDHGAADGVTTTVVDDGFGTGVDKVAVAIPRSLEQNGVLFARLRVTIVMP